VIRVKIWNSKYIQGNWKVTSYFKFFITLKYQKISSWFFHHFEAWTMAFCSRWKKSIDRLTSTKLVKRMRENDLLFWIYCRSLCGAITRIRRTTDIFSLFRKEYLLRITTLRNREKNNRCPHYSGYCSREPSVTDSK